MSEVSYNAPGEWAPTEVHDWEGKERDVLVLNYTMACPLNCDFCCYGCHPKRKEKMDVALAMSLVEQAGKMPNFSSVGFTGGEAMMFPEDVLQIGEACVQAKLPITLATAAHWGEQPEQARELVRRLKAVGLIRMNISHDPSHKKFVSDDSVCNVALAAAEAGIATYIVGTFYDPDQTMEAFLPRLANRERIKLVTKYVAKIGRAMRKDISQERYRLKLSLDELGCYRMEHHDLVVFYDGKVYPCCSTFNRATPGLVVGDANETSLRELWERVHGSLMLRMMKRQGFGEFYATIREYDPELYARLPRVQDCAGPCSLCSKVLGKELQEQVIAVFQRYERDRLEEMVQALSLKLGGERVDQMFQRALQAP